MDKQINKQAVARLIGAKPTPYANASGKRNVLELSPYLISFTASQIGASGDGDGGDSGGDGGCYIRARIKYRSRTEMTD